MVMEHSSESDLDGLSSTIAAQLAGFIHDLKFEELPPDAIAATKSLVLDQLACQVIGSTVPWVEPAKRLVWMTRGSSAEATVVGCGMKFLAAEASFANATFGQACELDDTAYASAGHMGAATVPVALAVGEANRIDGRSFILAIVCGFEVMYRLMAAIRPFHSSRGFHSQSIAGPFAGAAVASKIMGLSKEQTLHALSIAGSHACGPVEFDQSGGEVKRVHAGLAARSGVHSALLAQFGLTGPPTIIEGKRGFCNIFATQSDPSRIIDDLGNSLNVANVFFKIHAAVGTIHAAISAFAQLIDEHRFAPSQVARVRVGMAETTMLHGASIRYPTDVVSAQFSLAFSLALVACGYPTDLSSYTNPALWCDYEISRLIDRVEPFVELAAIGEKDHMARVQVTLENGQSFENVEEYRKGTPRNPVTWSELAEKARRLTSGALSEGGAEQLISCVNRLENLDCVADLAQLLAGQA
jgi:2-methylcitrate dehydratase PrpD